MLIIDAQFHIRAWFLFAFFANTTAVAWIIDPRYTYLRIAFGIQSVSGTINIKITVTLTKRTSNYD